MSREALDQARLRLEEALAANTGGYEGFQRLSSAKSEWDTQMSLNHPCYGEPFKCISCGCSEGRPCVSHEGSRRHMADLKVREVEALEHLAYLSKREQTA